MATTYKGISVETPRSTDRGNAMCLVSQTVTVSAKLTEDDIVRFGPFPAGIKPSHVLLVHGDLDTDGTPALVASVGIAYVDGSGGDDDLFGASLTSFQAASGVGGTQLAATQVAEIQKDWYLEILVTTTADAMASATTIFAVVFGEAVGVK